MNHAGGFSNNWYVARCALRSHQPVEPATGAGRSPAAGTLPDVQLPTVRLADPALPRVRARVRPDEPRDHEHGAGAIRVGQMGAGAAPLAGERADVRGP